MEKMQYEDSRNFFIKSFAKDIKNGNACIFFGAGLSSQSGYPDWKDLLADLTREIGLDIEKEHDYIALAQYYANEKYRTTLSSKISTIFAPSSSKSMQEVHKLILGLPIKYYWTTNYDNLFEKACHHLAKKFKALCADEDLSLDTNGIDILLHKIHGDYKAPHRTIITKEDFEQYMDTHDMMLTRLKSLMSSKSFLFLGYSVNDPNINFVLSRIKKVFHRFPRNHYIIIKRPDKTILKDGKEIEKSAEELNYELNKQKIIEKDWETYGLHTIFVDDYTGINSILKELRNAVYEKDIVISGSCLSTNENKEFIENFTQNLIKRLIKENYKIRTGNGEIIGDCITNGLFSHAIDCIQGKDNPDFDYTFENYCVATLFPKKSSAKLKNITKIENQNVINKIIEKIRNNFIEKSTVTIIICGENKNENNKKETNNHTTQGVLAEYDISVINENIIIPIGCTGGVAQQQHEKILALIKKMENEEKDKERLKKIEQYIKEFEKLGHQNNTSSLENNIDSMIDATFNILSQRKFYTEINKKIIENHKTKNKK